jgi:hypothetical protein
MHLFGLSESDGVSLEVVDGVIAAEEGIAQDGERAGRLRNVNTLEGRDAGAAGLEDVVVRADREVDAVEGEGQIR